MAEKPPVLPGSRLAKWNGQGKGYTPNSVQAGLEPSIQPSLVPPGNLMKYWPLPPH